MDREIFPNIEITTHHTSAMSANNTTNLNSHATTIINDEFMKELMNNLKEDGYVVIPSVISRDESAKLRSQWWSIMSDITSGRIKEGELDGTFVQSTHFPHEQHGILTDPAIGQNGVSWAIRTNKNVMRFFRKFHGTNSLMASYDRVNHQLAGLQNKRLDCTNEHGKMDESKFVQKQVTWLHVDQKPGIEGGWKFEGIQSFVDLIGTEGEEGSNGGCFVCSPGSHHFNLTKHLQDAQSRGLYNTKVITQMLKSKITNPYGFYKFTNEERACLLKQYPTKRIVSLKDGSPIPPGSMVVWDSRLFHQGSKSVGPITRERLCIYVNMEPRPDPIPPTLLAKRVRYFNENRSCSHSPVHVKVFGGPQTYGKDVKLPLILNNKTIQKPKITRRINQLIGITKHRTNKGKGDVTAKPFYRHLLIQ